jgi:uncharacterized repeat protein (TIGR01451 family)
MLLVAASAACLSLAACATGPDTSKGIRGDTMRDWDQIFPPAAPAPQAVPAARTAPAASGGAAPAPVSSSRGGCRNYSPAAGADANVTMLAHPTGNPDTSWVFLHQVMPSEVRANQTFTHEIHVTNVTDKPLYNVVVMDAGETKNLTYIDSTPKGETTRDGGRMWVVGDLGACETKIIKLSSRAGAVGEAGNCMVVSYDNNLCAITNVVDPRLEIVKKAPSEVSLCDNIPMEFVVKNAGTGALSNVVIKDQLPAGLTTLDGRTNVELPVGVLAQGESKTVTLTTKAANVGRFENSATASSGDITASSNRTTTVVRQAKLQVTCEPETSEYVNRTLTMKYTVRNTGDVACTGTKLVVDVPASTNFEAATNGGTFSGGKVTWDLGSIPAGGSTSVSLDSKTTAIQTVTATATATCGCADPATTSCSSEIRGIPAVLLEVVDLVDPVEVGTQTTYKIIVTNQGSADDTNITMVVDLPPELTFVSAGGATQPSSTGQRTVFTPYGRLPAGAQIEWTIVAKANKAANIRSRFTMTTEETKARGVIEETESTTLYD